MGIIAQSKEIPTEDYGNLRQDYTNTSQKEQPQRVPVVLQQKEDLDQREPKENKHIIVLPLKSVTHYNSPIAFRGLDPHTFDDQSEDISPAGKPGIVRPSLNLASNVKKVQRKGASKKPARVKPATPHVFNPQSSHEGSKEKIATLLHQAEANFQETRRKRKAERVGASLVED